MNSRKIGTHGIRKDSRRKGICHLSGRLRGRACPARETAVLTRRTLGSLTTGVPEDPRKKSRRPCRIGAQALVEEVRGHPRGGRLYLRRSTALEENDVTATYTFDIFSSLDGYGAHSGDWGGYWGKQGPELLDHRLALYAADQRMVFGANTYRAFAGMLASSAEESEVRDAWVTRMRNLPATVVSTHAARSARLAGRDRRERRRGRCRRSAQGGVRGSVALARQPVLEPGADGRRSGRPRAGDDLPGHHRSDRGGPDLPGCAPTSTWS